MRRERLIRPTCAIPRPDKTRQASHPAIAPRHWRMRRERLIRLHVQSRRPDKTRQASHPAFIAPLRTGRQSARAGGTRVTAQTNIFLRGLRPCTVMPGCCTHISQPLVDPNFRYQLTYRINSVTIVGFFSSQRPTNLTKPITTNHPVKFHHRWQQHGVRQTVRNMQRRPWLMRHRVA